MVVASEQFAEFTSVLRRHDQLMTVLSRASELGIEYWYVGAGAIAQTWWNHMHGFDLSRDIKDIDLVYFDPDLSYEAEDRVIQKGAVLFPDVTIPVEIRNQARVHLWYSKHFGGADIHPHVSTEDAIDRWPTTATAIGVRLTSEGQLDIYAPFGLEDLLALRVRANKRKVTQDIYEEKAKRWQASWPKLEVVPW